jgi:GNAT superfamily N-acetyltransferase
VFSDADPDWVKAQLPDGDLGAPLQPPFLSALCSRTGRVAGSIDMLCFAPGLGGEPSVALEPVNLVTDEGVSAGHHPRIERAFGYRDDVRAWETQGGVVLLGRGIAAIEVDPDCRARGLGRTLATAARHLVPAGETLWAQVAPANAASVRAFLAAGFIPVGAEVLLAAGPRGA